MYFNLREMGILWYLRVVLSLMGPKDSAGWFFVFLVNSDDRFVKLQWYLIDVWIFVKYYLNNMA